MENESEKLALASLQKGHGLFEAPVAKMPIRVKPSQALSLWRHA
jgi:hypothetical protein